VKKGLGILLRLLGLNREQLKPGRIIQSFGYTVIALTVIYLSFKFLPKILLPHKLQAHGITVYAREPFDSDAESILSAIHLKIISSTIYGDDQQFIVCICNNKWLYALFSPFHSRSFAITNPILQCIILADADVSLNQSRRFAPDHNVRSFTGVVSHEIGHLILQRKFGVLTFLRLPT